MILSATTYPFITLPLDSALAAVAEAGFSHVDLLGRAPHFTLDPRQTDPQTVLDAARRHGLTIANFATYCGTNFISDDQAARQQEWQDVAHAIDCAAMFGSRSIRVFRFGSPADDPVMIPRLVPWLQKAAEYGRSRGVKLGIENHHGKISGSPEHCRELVDAVGLPQWFGVLYDPANLLSAGADYQKALDLLSDCIVHVHLKDGTTERNSQKTTMLGEGMIDTPWLLRQLEEIGYDGHLTLEYEVETTKAEVGLKMWLDQVRAMMAAV